MRNQDKGKPLKHKKTRDTITNTSESIPEEFRDTGTDSHNTACYDMGIVYLQIFHRFDELSSGLQLSVCPRAFSVLYLIWQLFSLYLSCILL